MAHEIVTCHVESCPTPKIIVVKKPPPTPIPKIDFRGYNAISTNLNSFLNKEGGRTFERKTKEASQFNVEEFLVYLKGKDMDLFRYLKRKIKLKSNENLGYLVVYCETGHKNIVPLQDD